MCGLFNKKPQSHTCVSKACENIADFLFASADNGNDPDQASVGTRGAIAARPGPDALWNT